MSCSIHETKCRRVSPESHMHANVGEERQTNWQWFSWGFVQAIESLNPELRNHEQLTTDSWWQRIPILGLVCTFQTMPVLGWWNSSWALCEGFVANDCGSIGNKMSWLCLKNLPSWRSSRLQENYQSIWRNLSKTPQNQQRRIGKSHDVTGQKHEDFGELRPKISPDTALLIMDSQPTKWFISLQSDSTAHSSPPSCFVGSPIHYGLYCSSRLAKEDHTKLANKWSTSRQKKVKCSHAKMAQV